MQFSITVSNVMRETICSSEEVRKHERGLDTHAERKPDLDAADMVLGISMTILGARAVWADTRQNMRIALPPESDRINR